MNKNEKMSFLKGKGAAIGIVVCFMAVPGGRWNIYGRKLQKRYERADGES